MRQAQAEKRKRRSGASHATVELPAVRDDRETDMTPDRTVSETEGTPGEDGEDFVFERRRRSVYDENAAAEEQALEYSARIEEKGRTRLRTVNWIKIWIAVFAGLILIGVGTWFFLDKTEAGQKIMARLGRDATSSALWAVGEEQMNSGDIDGAIATFEKAKKQECIIKHGPHAGEIGHIESVFNGTPVPPFNTGDGSSRTLTYTIPSNLRGVSPITIWMRDPGECGFYSYNYFYNATTNW